MGASGSLALEQSSEEMHVVLDDVVEDRSTQARVWCRKNPLMIATSANNWSCYQSNGEQRPKDISVVMMKTKTIDGCRNA